MNEGTSTFQREHLILFSFGVISLTRLSAGSKTTRRSGWFFQISTDTKCHVWKHPTCGLKQLIKQSLAAPRVEICRAGRKTQMCCFCHGSSRCATYSTIIFHIQRLFRNSSCELWPRHKCLCCVMQRYCTLIKLMCVSESIQAPRCPLVCCFLSLNFFYFFLLCFLDCSSRMPFLFQPSSRICLLKAWS